MSDKAAWVMGGDTSSGVWVTKRFGPLATDTTIHATRTEVLVDGAPLPLLQG